MAIKIMLIVAVSIMVVRVLDVFFSEAHIRTFVGNLIVLMTLIASAAALPA